jgi:hypothetical protein
VKKVKNILKLIFFWRSKKKGKGKGEGGSGSPTISNKFEILKFLWNQAIFLYRNDVKNATY